MKVLTSPLVLAAFLGMAHPDRLVAQTPAQPNPAEVAFTKDAGEVFDAVVGQIEFGMVFAPELRDRFMHGLELTKTSTFDPSLIGSSGGRWQGQNSSGTVSVYISTPMPLNKASDMGTVTFWPHAEQPIPQALLTHLLAKAERTKLSGADTLELELSAERPSPQAKCSSQRILTIRLGTGAMVSNTVKGYCDVLRK